MNGDPYIALELESQVLPGATPDVFRDQASHRRWIACVSGDIADFGIGGQEFCIDHVCWR